MCLSPNLVRSRLDKSTGAIVTVFLGKAGEVDPRTFGEPYVDSEWYTTVPCGKCRECKMDYAKQWANRMVLEAQDWPKNLFFTATYNNENLPFDSSSGMPTLDKRDVQLFMKRLRKYFAPQKIRFTLLVNMVLVLTDPTITLSCLISDWKIFQTERYILTTNLNNRCITPQPLKSYGLMVLFLCLTLLGKHVTMSPVMLTKKLSVKIFR